MSVYRMKDGSVVDTADAKNEWEEESDWNLQMGADIPRVTKDRFTHEALYEAPDGRFYSEYWADYQGSEPRAQWLSDQEAVHWLLANDNDVPERLKHLIAEDE